MFLRDLWHVVMQLPLAHWPTIAFGLGTLVVMSALKKWLPKLPGVLAVVVLGTILSAAVGFEKTALVAPEAIIDTAARAEFAKFAQLETDLVKNKQTQSKVRKQISTLGTDVHDYTLESEMLRLEGEEKSLKKRLYGQRVAVYRHALEPVTGADGQEIGRAHV